MDKAARNVEVRRGGTMEEQDKLLTVEDLAEWLQKPLSWVYRHTTDSRPPAKRLPAVRLDRGLRFQRHEIQAWLNAHSTRQNAVQESRESAPETRLRAPRASKHAQIGVGTPLGNANGAS